VSGDPKFIGTSDLHIDSNAASPVSNAGTYANIFTDIDNDTRDNNTPDIGADEYNAPVNGTLNLTIIMEGFYNASSNNMMLSDTFTVYFRNSTSPYAVVDSSTSVIDANSLAGSFLILNAATGNYYIQTKHRNTIETWSDSAISYTVGATISHDFTTSASQAFGDNMKQVDTSPVRFAIYSADVNQDDVVDLTDIINVFNDANLFLSGYVVTDVNGDDFVDLSDITITYNNANLFVSTITP
jgi:hypothetical protein